MSAQPKLTDQRALRRNQLRAIQRPESAMFLQEAAVLEIKERLNQVNRSFTSIAIVARFPEIWENAFPDAMIVPNADTLALDKNAHDLVIHALSLHWADDFVGQLIQCQRALKPDGLFLAACFGGQTLNELRSCLAQAEVEIYGGLSPRIVPMAEIREIGDLLFRAGFALPVADSVISTVSYRDTKHLMHDLRAMGETNALAQRKLSPVGKKFFARVESIYQDVYGTGNGRVSANFETIYLTGWHTDANQQKPLRPGSAIARLSDALGSHEVKLED